MDANELGALLGLIGGILGTLLGIAGGAIGTYFSVKNTDGPRERAFMIKISVVVWLAVTLFLAVLFVTPAPFRSLVWIPYSLLLPWGIYTGNKRQNEIRLLEQQEQVSS